MQQRGGEPDLLPHPGRVVDDQRPLGVAGRSSTSSSSPARAGHRRRVEAAELPEVGEQLAAGELLGHRQPVGQNAHQRLRALGLLPHVGAEHERAAGVGPQQPDRHRQRRRLARAVRPDEPEERAGLDGQIGVLDGRMVAERLAQAGCLERGRHRKARTATTATIRTAIAKIMMTSSSIVVPFKRDEAVRADSTIRSEYSGVTSAPSASG